MPSDVHRDPERLRAHAAVARELADALQAALQGVGRPESFDVRHGAALDDLDTAVQRALRELADLGAALAAAATIDVTDAEAAGALRHVVDRA